MILFLRLGSWSENPTLFYDSNLNSSSTIPEAHRNSYNNPTHCIASHHKAIHSSNRRRLTAVRLFVCNIKDSRSDSIIPVYRWHRMSLGHKFKGSNGKVS